MKRSLGIHRVLSAAALGLLFIQSASAWEGEKQERLSGQDRTVTVRRGQSLYDIARTEGFALEHLAEANGLPVSLAAVNRSSIRVPALRITPLDAPVQGVVVNLPERGFYLFRTGEEPRFYPVAIGEPGRFQTPPGRYSIREKVRNPEWIAPEWAGMGEDNVVPAGPNNPLGDRWLGLSASGLGMHSTNNPMSIGSASSHGCMRMYPEVAREVFDLVEAGWPVTIEYRTSRVAIAEDGIYLSCFPDPYRRGGQLQQLLDNFEKLDLSGFVGFLDLETYLQKPTGLSQRVVELDLATVIDGDEYPAAMISQKVFLTGTSLDKLGAEKNIVLAERSITVKLKEREIRLPLVLSGDKPQKGAAFLSRGSVWLPAKEVLEGLSLNYEWDNSQRRLRIHS